jgi:hypothetical protein
MRALIEVLRSQTTGVSGGDVTAAELAERELAKDEPDKTSLLGYLQILAAGAGSLASIGTAITALQHAVTALL